MSTSPITAPPRRLLTSADLDTNKWAACGQAAVAALLWRPLEDVRRAFPPHRWCNLAQMRQALAALGIAWKNGSAENWPPPRGLALIQFNGPWTAPGVPAVAALKHTHWIAVGSRLIVGASAGVTPIFDVNVVGSDANGGWIGDAEWRGEVVPYILEDKPKASGTWRVRASLEVPT